MKPGAADDDFVAMLQFVRDANEQHHLIELLVEKDAVELPPIQAQVVHHFASGEVQQIAEPRRIVEGSKCNETGDGTTKAIRPFSVGAGPRGTKVEHGIPMRPRPTA